MIVTLYENHDWDVNYVNWWKADLDRWPKRSLTYDMDDKLFDKIALRSTVEESKELIRDILHSNDY